MDTELHAILMALEMTAEREEPEKRRCLIMSDSLTALEMIEEAWRRGVKWTGPRSGRAAILNAIIAAREKLELVVTMWVPAHVGVAPNAYADAAAKAHLLAPATDTEEEITRALPKGRYIQTVVTGEGRRMWPMTRYTAVKESMGWWVRQREVRKDSRKLIETDALGPKWRMRGETRWGEVWKGTGARTKGGAAGKKEENGEKLKTLLEEAEEGATGRKKERGKGKRTGKKPSVKEVSMDRGRCGVAMAARAGRLGEVRETTQGCAGCCTRARGWRWAGNAGERRRWEREGEEVIQASLLHVMCGECEGVKKGERERERTTIRGSMQRARKAVTRRGVKKGAPPVLGEGREEIIRIIAAAQRAFAKGAKAKEHEREALRRWLAGDLPKVSGDSKEKVESIASAVAENVREAQRAAAELNREWKEASEQETARRQEVP